MSRRLAGSLAMLVAWSALLVASAPAGRGAESPRGGTLRFGSGIDVAVDPTLQLSSHAFRLLEDPYSGRAVRNILRRRMEAADRRTGASRLRAFADLDVDLMGDDPPWAPVVHTQQRMLVSKSLGCFVHHPVVGVDITALCTKR